MVIWFAFSLFLAFGLGFFAGGIGDDKRRVCSVDVHD